jgi:hypothetical protein
LWQYRKLDFPPPVNVKVPDPRLRADHSNFISGLSQRSGFSLDAGIAVQVAHCQHYYVTALKLGGCRADSIRTLTLNSPGRPPKR